MFKISKKPKDKGSITKYLEKSEFNGSGFDYYQEFGTWAGLGAERLGLAGLPILKGEMDKLANCIHPKTGEKIGKKSRNGIDDAFLKTTLSAPKDFSLIYFLDETLGQKELEKDYRDSVNETLKFMEEFALTKINSNNDMKKSGLIIANITHETSRPTKEHDSKSILRPDPQKHEHSLLSRLVVDENGKVSALSNKLFFKNQIMIGTFFRKCLANKLRERGYTITRRTEFIDRDEKGTYSKNPPKVKINSFAVDGITDEHRKYFSKRNTEIEALAQKYGANTAVAKDFVANEYKTAKGNYERGELIEIWKNDGKKIGLTDEYLQSIKNKTPVNNFLKNFRTDEELLASVVSKGNVFFKDIMSRLYEDEQWTGRKAEEVFQGLVDSGKLESDGKFKFKCKADLSLVVKKGKRLNMKISVDRNKTYRALSQMQVSVDNFLDNVQVVLKPLSSSVKSTLGVEIAKMLVQEEKNEIKAQREVERKWAQVRPAQNKKPAVSDAEAGLVGDSTISTIEGLQGQLFELNSKLTLPHLSENQKIRIKLKMDILTKKILKLKTDALNNSPKLK